MSITVRLWSKEELDALPKDPHAMTVFMDGKTFGDKEWSYRGRYSSHVKTYYAFIGGETLTFRAVNDESALWFLSQEYTVPPESLCELIRTFREVSLVP